MTFSIAGRCARTGQVGVAITTSSIAVGARCPWVKAGVGVVSTQNVTMPQIGPDVLEWMAAGDSAQVALDSVMDRERYADYRQVSVVSAQGETAVFSGAQTLGRHGAVMGADCVAAGNLLASEALPSVMVRAFEGAAEMSLPERLLHALETGLGDGGGEAGPVHSAALLVADKQPWPLVDLRIDWDDRDPVKALRRLWQAYAPEMEAYVTRALNPEAAPSYGVPGDE